MFTCSYQQAEWKNMQRKIRKRSDDLAIRRGGKNIIRMSAFQAFTLVRDRFVSADQYGLNEGRMINGQKIFIQVIAGTTDLTVSACMDDLFRGLTP